MSRLGRANKRGRKFGLVNLAGSTESYPRGDDLQLGVPVGPVPLHVLPDGDSLLDEVVKVLRDLGSQT